METDWYLHKCRHSIPEYKYYHDKHINKGYNIHYLAYLYLPYRLYCAYNLMKNYMIDTNTQYNYIINIRPDVRLMENLIPLFNILDTTNIQVISEHNMLTILKYKVRKICKLINYYGIYTENINILPSIYLFYSRTDEFDGNDPKHTYTSEKQFIDHVYTILSINNYNLNDSFIGITYPSYNVLYRGNGIYGYIDNYHLIDTIPWVPFTDINLLTQKLTLL
jgi:hypothetical protein